MQSHEGGVRRILKRPRSMLWRFKVGTHSWSALLSS
jgi:hypothetical protein